MIDIKKRGKGKINSDIKALDLYNYYKKNIKPVESLSGGKTLGSFDIKQKDYTKILKDINGSIAKIIVTENFEFKIPCGLGYISMKQKKIDFKLDENGELYTKNLSVDQKATRDLWNSDEESRLKKVLIFHTNEHTNGNRMAYWWSKAKTKTFGLSNYYFRPCRTMSRMPAKYLKDSNYNLMYFEKLTEKDKNILIYNNKNKC